MSLPASCDEADEHGAHRAGVRDLVLDMMMRAHHAGMRDLAVVIDSLIDR